MGVRRARRLRPPDPSVRYLVKGTAPAAGGLHRDVSYWIAAVQAQGGTVSGTQSNLVNTLVTSMAAAGVYDLYDDFFLGRAENVTQLLVSFKRRQIGQAINSPLFTAHDCMAFDGVASWLNTNSPTAGDGLGVTGGNQRLDVWETTNLTVNGTTIGSSTPGGASLSMFIRPRTATVASGGCNCSPAVSITLPLADSTGLTAFSRPGGQALMSLYKNGAFVASGAPTTINNVGTSSTPIGLGCLNNSTGPTSFRAAHFAWGGFGQPGSAANELAIYNAINTYLASAVQLGNGAPAPTSEVPMVLVLTPLRAASVRGVSPTDPLHALEPRPLEDGNFILPVSVLEDPAHADDAAVLADCPMVPAGAFPELFAEVEA